MAVSETKREGDHEEDYVYVRQKPVGLNLWKINTHPALIECSIALK